MKLRFEFPVPAHARIVAANMRAQDILEVKAGWGLEPEEAILNAVRNSPKEACTLFYGLEILAIFGLSPLSILGESAQVWCFGTTAIDRHPVIFGRASKRILAALFQHARILTNVVDIEDEKALRWLEFLGATYVLQPELRGGRLFGQFILAGYRGAQCQQV
jgi:hypothetical protein